MVKKITYMLNILTKSLSPNNQGQKSANFIIETQEGSPASLKFFYWLSKLFSQANNEFTPEFSHRMLRKEMRKGPPFYTKLIPLCLGFRGLVLSPFLKVWGGGRVGVSFRA